MLQVKYTYSDKSFILKPYKTSQEKDLLLLSVVAEPDLDIALSICGTENTIIETLTHDEKLAMLFKYREISIGSEINIQFKCSHCNANNENTIDIENLIQNSNITNYDITDVYKNMTEDNINEFIKSDVEELDLDVYSSLYKEIQDTCTKFNFIRETNCQKCTKIHRTNIGSDKFCIDTLSDDSLVSLYQTYNDLIFYGKYSKLDIDSLYPFERTILIGIMNKTKEELNK